MKYPKIEGLFKRGDGPKGPGTGKLIIGEFRRKEVELIKRWDVYEKIDGMNMRVIFGPNPAGGDGICLSFRGRTDRAEIPKDLLEYMQETFPFNKMMEKFSSVKDGATVILYGEGYGPGIQKGGNYCSSKRFRLFDVLVGGGGSENMWLEQENVKDIAETLGIRAAPLLGRWNMNYLIKIVREEFTSMVALKEADFIPSSPYARKAEGVVARTNPSLFDRHGKRLIIKLKTKDFSEGEEK